ncbi:MAG: prolyl oligopeptidase family serine peptidase [candidate division KSB1 bacterium]|nr:prolyl oligopeptidase family serine peptidase [candidate division KSB1 bacterium]
MKLGLLMLMVGAVCAFAQENLIKNGEFDDGRKYWSVRKENDAEMTVEYPKDSQLSGEASCLIKITKGGNQRSDVYAQQGVVLEEGKAYRLSFMARANVPHTILVQFKESDGLQRVLWESPLLELQDEPRHYGPFLYNCNLNANAVLKFLLGGKDNVEVRLDSVWLTREDRPGYVKTVDKFLKRVHTFQGTTIPYRLCFPDFYDPAQRYPLVLALHGAGERGDDNQIHIELHRLATSWADSANQKKYPCFVVAPQCPADNRWVDSDWSTGYYRISDTPVSNELLAVVDLLDSLVAAYSIDADRLYVTGLSMGGYGTWDLITRWPDKFAAAVPMSGGGDSTRADRIKHLPIWAFHGQVDNTVPPQGSRQMIQALERRGRQAVYTHCRVNDCTGLSDDEIAAAVAGGATLLYTEWKGKSHVMWAESYDYPYLFPWVFAQNRKNNPPAVGVKKTAEIPELTLTLKPAYPNPFNPETTIELALKRDQEVRIEVYDLLGKRAALLFEGRLTPGVHQIPFRATGLSSGVYIVQASAEGQIVRQSLTLQK